MPTSGGKKQGFSYRARIVAQPWGHAYPLAICLQEGNRLGDIAGTRRRRQAIEENFTIGAHHQPIVANHQHAAIVGIADQASNPCFRVMTASGSCTSLNGSPPRNRQSSIRAFNNGSSGEVNGSLSIITHDNASPRTSTPPRSCWSPPTGHCLLRQTEPATGPCWFPLQQHRQRHGGTELLRQFPHHLVRSTKEEAAAVIGFNQRP